jgi:hypothetical protein
MGHRNAAVRIRSPLLVGIEDVDARADGRSA